MRTIDIKGNRDKIRKLADQTGPRDYPRTTVLTYGKSRAGKTFFTAGFPRPLILADSTESGWKTIEEMSEDQFYEPGVVPTVMAIETLEDFVKIQGDLAGIIKSGGHKTVGISSLTFLNDLVLAGMEAKGMGRSKSGEDDPRALYGRFKNLLRAFRIQLHSLDVNIVWECLEAAIDDKTKMSGPQINGQSREMFPAACDLYMYQVKHATSRGVIYYSHTTQYGPYPAGGRFGTKLPPVIQNLDYRLLVHYLYEDGLRRDSVAATATESPALETQAEGDTGAASPTDAVDPTEPLTKGRAAVPAPAARTQPARTPVAAVRR